MKRIILVICLLSSPLISGCNTNKDNSTPTDHENQDSGEEDIKKVGEFFGGVSSDSSFTGYDFSKSLEPIEKPKSGVGDINIYSFNDFHGAVVESATEVGLKRLGSFYKEKSQLPNTLILDQGDTWQGSFESNYEHGAIVQDVFNYAGVSLRTVGNHDFDWGLTTLKEVTERKIGDDYIPSLAANVFNYSNGTAGTTQQKEYGLEYSTFTLDNGIKVGIVGVIGESQITSISSQLVETICFTNHVDKIKEVSDYLRVTKECDVVVASTHESSTEMYENGDSITDISPISHQRYVDLVLGGHSHYTQNYEKNGVRFVQWNSNGNNNGFVNLKFDFNTNKILDDQTGVNTYNLNYMISHYSTIDPIINSMVDDYLENIESISNEVLSTHFVDEFDTESIARVMTEAIYSRVSKSVPDLDFAVSNYGREGFSGSTFKYSDLYKSFPFDNEIIVLNVSSNYGINRLFYDYTYRDDTSLNPEYGHTYRCAIIDYVALHQDENREFDRYADALNGYSVFNDTDKESLTYREILYDYLKANPDKVFDALNYQSNSEHFVN